jgi:hypothetical protein
MGEDQIVNIWTLFKPNLDKKAVEIAAEKFVDLLADYGVEDNTFTECLGYDKYLDAAINYYLDLDLDGSIDDDEWDD